jgi:aspartate-semialdehyde dehydrogenase
MLRLLRERAFPAREIVPFASERSAGRELDGGLIVQPLADETIQGFDLAIFSAGGSTSGEWAPRFVEAGAVVVDNSSKWRMADDVPLVVSEVNPTRSTATAGSSPTRTARRCRWSSRSSRSTTPPASSAS